MATSAPILNRELRSDAEAAAVDGTTDFLNSFCVSGIVLVAFWLLSPQTQHWFVIPVFACGVIIGADASKWFRGGMDIFSPVGIIGLLGFHFFFLAPLLHVRWDLWMQYVVPPDDWRPWLGAMASLNFLGLVVYRFFRGVRIARVGSERRSSYWEIDRTRFLPILITALAFTGIAQLLTYVVYGGIGGYIAAYSSRYSDPQAGFQGMGIAFMLAESFPILAVMGYVVYARASLRTRSWIEIGAVLLVFLGLKLLFGGLRGSRSNTVWGVFWAAALIHLYVRPISKKLVLAALVPIVAFLYLYGFYKTYGDEVFEAYQESGGSLVALEESSGRSLEGLLLGDLGRSDVQAFLLYRLNSPEVRQEYTYALGQTYVGGAAVAVPRQIWPDKPETKVKWGTNALYGDGSYESRGGSSRVYGLAGEAMLNFGLVAAPMSFVVLGLVVGRVRRWFAEWSPSDSRLLMYPLLINLCFVVLASDSDNFVFFLVKNGLVPFMVILLSSRRRVRTGVGTLSMRGVGGT